MRRKHRHVGFPVHAIDVITGKPRMMRQDGGR